MRTKKKALIVMLIAIVMSMGIMAHVASNRNSVNAQYIAVTCSVAAASSEGGTAGAYGVAAAAATGGAGYFYNGAVVAISTGVGAPVAVAGALLGTICTL